jgi:hypothetical protein
MNCFTHETTSAVGICVACQRAVCKRCIGRDAPRLVCTSCLARGILGFEYRSAAAIGTWPLVHICLGLDLVTMRPKVAKGLIAIGNIAVGGVALGGVSAGLFTIGGLSLGLLVALGGVALGVGLSLGGFAVGTCAIGGVAVGLQYAIGGAAVGPAIVNGLRCDQAAREFVLRWLPAGLPPSCR